MNSSQQQKAVRRTFCPEDGRACYTPEGPEPEGFQCANYGLCKSFEPSRTTPPSDEQEVERVIAACWKVLRYLTASEEEQLRALLETQEGRK